MIPHFGQPYPGTPKAAQARWRPLMSVEILPNAMSLAPLLLFVGAFVRLRASVPSVALLPYTGGWDACDLRRGRSSGGRPCGPFHHLYCLLSRRKESWQCRPRTGWQQNPVTSVPVYRIGQSSAVAPIVPQRAQLVRNTSFDHSWAHVFRTRRRALLPQDCRSPVAPPTSRYDGRAQGSPYAAEVFEVDGHCSPDPMGSVQHDRFNGLSSLSHHLLHQSQRRTAAEQLGACLIPQKPSQFHGHNQRVR